LLLFVCLVIQFISYCLCLSFIIFHEAIKLSVQKTRKNNLQPVTSKAVSHIVECTVGVQLL